MIAQLGGGVGVTFSTNKTDFVKFPRIPKTSRPDTAERLMKENIEGVGLHIL